MRDTVYIATPAPDEGDRISDALSSDKYAIRCFASADDLIAALEPATRGCVVAPVDLPGIGIRGLIAEVRNRKAFLTVVAIGRKDDLRLAVELVRAGASEFVEPPMSRFRLRSAVRRALAAAHVARKHCGGS